VRRKGRNRADLGGEKEGKGSGEEFSIVKRGSRRKHRHLRRLATEGRESNGGWSAKDIRTIRIKVGDAVLVGIKSNWGEIVFRDLSGGGGRYPLVGS